MTALASAYSLPPDAGFANPGGLYSQSGGVADLTTRTEVMMRNSLRLYSVGDEEVVAPGRKPIHLQAHAPGAAKPEAGARLFDMNQDRQPLKDNTIAAAVGAASVPLSQSDLDVSNFFPSGAVFQKPADQPVNVTTATVEEAGVVSISAASSTTGGQLSPTDSSPKAPSQQGAENQAPPDPLAVAAAAAATAEAPDKRDARPQGKSAAAEVLQLCQRQGIPLKLPELHMQPQVHMADFIPVSNAALALAPGMPPALAAAGLPAVSGAMAAPRKYQDLVLGNPLDASVQGQGAYSASAVAGDVALPVLQEVDSSLPIEQQLSAAMADKARLLAAVQNLQAICARKDEQLLDMQQRDELFQQQHLQLQSMYHGLLDQLQREQQQWASDCSQLQGELRSKQNVEELTKLLTNQLRQEQRQKKSVMAQLQAESSARQQLQDQLVATRMQLQKLQANADSLQWLQSTRNKLQNDLRMANAHLQMERQRNSDISMQLQSVLSAKQQLEQEVAALRMQQRMPGIMDSTAGAAQAGAADGGIGYSQGTYLGGFADPGASNIQYQRINTTMASGQLPASPTGYIMQPAASMPMNMQAPSGFSSMVGHQY